jgi:hypothetical protein
MKAKLIPTARPDDSVAGHFEAMIESGPFRLLVSRIAVELKRAEETCVRSDSDMEIRHAQGAVMSLRTVLELPARLLAEMRRSTPV